MMAGIRKSRDASRSRWPRTLAVNLALLALFGVAGCGGFLDLTSTEETTDEGRDAPSAPLRDDNLPTSTDPLPPAAGSAEIDALVNDMVGPIVDIGAQMNRIAPFPDMTAPPGAEVLGFKATISPVLDGFSNDLARGRAALDMRVELEVPDADLADLAALFDQELRADGWEQIEQETSVEKPGDYNRIRTVYDKEGLESALGGDLLTITVNDRHSQPQIVVKYQEIVAGDRSLFEPWLGWEGASPFPPGGDVVGAGVRVTGQVRTSVHLNIERIYDAEPQTLRVGIVNAVAGSDYDETSVSDEFNVGLSHPDFEQAGVEIVPYADLSSVVLTVERLVAGF